MGGWDAYFDFPQAFFPHWAEWKYSKIRLANIQITVHAHTEAIARAHKWISWLPCSRSPQNWSSYKIPSLLSDLVCIVEYDGCNGVLPREKRMDCVTRASEQAHAQHGHTGVPVWRITHGGASSPSPIYHEVYCPQQCMHCFNAPTHSPLDFSVVHFC